MNYTWTIGQLWEDFINPKKEISFEGRREHINLIIHYMTNVDIKLLPKYEGPPPLIVNLRSINSNWGVVQLDTGVGGGYVSSTQFKLSIQQLYNLLIACYNLVERQFEICVRMRM